MPNCSQDRLVRNAYESHRPRRRHGQHAVSAYPNHQQTKNLRRGAMASEYAYVLPDAVV